MKIISRILIVSLAVFLLVCLPLSTYAEEYSYDDNCEYVLTTFKLEDTAYYPYRPLHIDPVSYNGICSIVGGLNGDTYYVGYSCYKRADVERYLDYLQYWGYEAEETLSAIPDMKVWHLVGVGTDADVARRPLVPVIDVYHATERELLIVAYSYLDAWLYDAWLEKPEWGWMNNPFKEASLPYTLQLREDAAICVEEVRLTKELYIIADEELLVYQNSLTKAMFYLFILCAVVSLPASFVFTVLPFPRQHAQNRSETTSAASFVSKFW